MGILLFLCSDIVTTLLAPLHPDMIFVGVGAGISGREDDARRVEERELAVELHVA